MGRRARPATPPRPVWSTTRCWAEVQAAIDDANRSVSRAESIRKFALLPHDLTIESGELTPTLKVRRSIVEKSYQHVIDGLYS